MITLYSSGINFGISSQFDRDKFSGDAYLLLERPYSKRKRFFDLQEIDTKEQNPRCSNSVHWRQDIGVLSESVIFFIFEVVIFENFRQRIGLNGRGYDLVVNFKV